MRDPTHSAPADPDSILTRFGPQPAARRCAHPGCGQRGEYRAPRSRDDLRDFQWLCLDHVRAFNQSWDFFKGMSRDEIERHRRDDVTWHRPTWRFGINGPKVVDPLGILGGEPERPTRARPRTQAEAALDVLGLAPGFTIAELRQRYRALVKQHHPDLHGGDRDQEERLKMINAAYTWILAHHETL